MNNWLIIMCICLASIILTFVFAKHVNVIAGSITIITAGVIICGCMFFYIPYISNSASARILNTNLDTIYAVSADPSQDGRYEIFYKDSLESSTSGETRSVPFDETLKSGVRITFSNNLKHAKSSVNGWHLWFIFPKSLRNDKISWENINKTEPAVASWKHIPLGGRYRRCSRCHISSENNADNGDYCPHCGAKMKNP